MKKEAIQKKNNKKGSSEKNATIGNRIKNAIKLKITK